MKIFFIRHGESTSDVEDRYGGAYDDHLTEKGREQARRLAQDINGRGIEKFYTSPLLRARETAEILALCMKCELEIADDLREQNYFAQLSGMTREEALLHFPHMVAMLPHADTPLPGAESRKDFIERVTRAFSRITSDFHAILGVVTHAGPIRRVVHEILGLGEIVHIDHGAIITLEDDHQQWKVLDLINVTFEHHHR